MKEDLLVPVVKEDKVVVKVLMENMGEMVLVLLVFNMK
tara:strand:- start:348 stop:461 length:114 start_codon:yes stop_codon:yes gene_type:complete